MLDPQVSETTLAVSTNIDLMDMLVRDLFTGQSYTGFTIAEALALSEVQSGSSEECGCMVL